MRKDIEGRKEYHREYMRQRRQGLTEGFNKTTEEGQGLTGVPDILDKLTDKVWRSKLEKICLAFKSSSNPHYINDVWMGDYNLSQVCELLECTS